MNKLEYAINMELEGQKYYLEQAEINKDNELNKIFELLAASEKEHAELLRRNQSQAGVLLEDSSIRSKVGGVFAGLKNNAWKQEQIPKQLEAYRFATIQEEKSIELYKDMLTSAVDQLEKNLFEFLIKQEKEHLVLFEELVTLLLRPDEWVESAEFGVREEY